MIRIPGDHTQCPPFATAPDGDRNMPDRPRRKQRTIDVIVRTLERRLTAAQQGHDDL